MYKYITLLSYNINFVGYGYLFLLKVICWLLIEYILVFWLIKVNNDIYFLDK